LFFRVTPARAVQQQSVRYTIGSALYALSRDAREVSGEIKLHQGSPTDVQKLHVLHARSGEHAEENSAREKQKARRWPG
jgi:hypothetical protein